jgi:hypothetical protein
MLLNYLCSKPSSKARQTGLVFAPEAVLLHPKSPSAFKHEILFVSLVLRYWVDARSDIGADGG